MTSLYSLSWYLNCLFSCSAIVSGYTAPIYTTFKDAMLHFLQTQLILSFVCSTVIPLPQIEGLDQLQL